MIWLGEGAIGLFLTKKILEPTIGSIGLIIVADFVELLAAMADEIEGFADVIELFGGV